MTTIELKLNLPDDLFATLQREAKDRAMPLDIVLVDLIRDYFEEPTNEQILANIREGMLDALSGKVRPAREFLDQLDRELDGNADQS